MTHESFYIVLGATFAIVLFGIFGCPPCHNDVRRIVIHTTLKGAWEGQHKVVFLRHDDVVVVWGHPVSSDKALTLTALSTVPFAIPEWAVPRKNDLSQGGWLRVYAEDDGACPVFLRPYLYYDEWVMQITWSGLSNHTDKYTPRSIGPFTAWWITDKD